MALESILGIADEAFELILVDQNPDDSTEVYLAPYLADDRLKYIHASDTKGLGVARNIGIQRSRGDVIAMTDDDCTVPVNWLEQTRSVFERYPNVGIMFCSVLAGEHDSKLGFIPGFECKHERVITDPITWRAGIGAGMALRRSAILEVGGFDEFLGAGAPLQAGEDSDIAIRMLAKNFAVCETDRTYVTHFGFRTYDQGKELTKRDSYGYGAALAKFVRFGSAAMRLSVALNFVYFIKVMLVASIKHRKPTGIKRLIFFAKGLRAGLKIPVDVDTLTFTRP